MNTQISHVKKRAYIEQATILRYLIAEDEKIDTAIMCNPQNFDLFTTDQALYEALCCIQKDDKFNLMKLKKLVENTEIVSSRVSGKFREILKHEKSEAMRKIALGSDEKSKDNNENMKVK